MNALDGIRIPDLSRVLAGPWCTQTLADLGADVVKVERTPGPQHTGGDDTRGWGPPFLRGRDGADIAESAYYLGANRNKRSITCDIAQPEGQALIREPVTKADVFMENWRAMGWTLLRCTPSTRVWCIAPSPALGRPDRTKTAPATTTPSKAWAA